MKLKLTITIKFKSQMEGHINLTIYRTVSVRKMHILVYCVVLEKQKRKTIRDNI